MILIIKKSFVILDSGTIGGLCEASEGSVPGPRLGSSSQNTKMIRSRNVKRGFKLFIPAHMLHKTTLHIHKIYQTVCFLS